MCVVVEITFHSLWKRCLNCEIILQLICKLPFVKFIDCMIFRPIIEMIP